MSSGPAPSVVEATTRAAVAALLAAIGRRDSAAIAATLDPGVTWANVPHPPAVGRAAVLAMLDSVIARSDRVRWDVVTAAYAGRRAHLERVDRFWIGGVEHAVACHGVVVVDTPTGLVTEVRDYVDLGEWRRRLAAADRSNVTDD